MEKDTNQAILGWIRFYGYVVLAAAIYGIIAAHVPVILGHQWSVCLIDGAVSIPCVLTIHLYDASLTFTTLFFSWYSLKKASVAKLTQYRTFLLSIIALELAFFTFESEELLWNFHNHAHLWENILISSIAIILLGGALLGMYVNHKVITLSQQT